MDWSDDVISLVFMRHGATSGNLEKRYIGRTDEPLCDIGIEQALKLKKCNFPQEHVFVSPMKRTKQTAEIVFPESEYTIVEDFRETDFGIFEGKNALELSNNEEYSSWVDSRCISPIPNGEDVMEFKERCINAFEKIIKSLPDKSEASFVVHGGVIMAILESYAEAENDFYDYHIKNGEFIVCKFENNKIIAGVNK